MELACFVLDHPEPSAAEIHAAISPVGRDLRTLAAERAATRGWEISALYADRLAGMENGKLGGLLAEAFRRLNPGEPLPAESVTDAGERELRRIQALHDRHFSADVVGMKPAKQLEHHCFHLAKLAGRAAEAQDGGMEPDAYKKHLADIFAFGVILANIAGELPEGRDAPAQG